MTSHDVVNFTRKNLGTRRIGHTGILDPNATGLLVLLVERGTLFSSFLTGMPKRYYARFKFGIATDTYDADGQVTSTSDPGNVPRRQFEELLGNFRGEIEQAIPTFSAVKRGGKTFHKLARKGVQFNPGLKVVEIKNIGIIEYDWPEAVLDIKCSSGTYVRSLAHQMGASLGCGGYLKSLRRTEVGPFRISEAHTLEDISRSREPLKLLRPLREALPSSPLIRIKPQYCGAVINGRPLVKRYIGENEYSGEGGVLSVLLGPDEKVLALAKLNMQWRSLERMGPSDIMGTYVRVIDEGHIGAK